MSGNFTIRMYDKQFFRILRQRYEDINSLLLITSRKKIIVATYVKLQEAYASENNAVGTWAAIGYKDPGAGNNHMTTNFDYSEKSETTDGMWVASNRVALNDCEAGKKWSLTTSYSSSDGTLTTTATSDDVANCVTALTPNFCKISTSGSCS